MRLYMATLTLTRMGEGGMYDQLGGGFARYSVDQFWMIPHFEKMLYDNGALLASYAEAALATGDALFKRIAAETGAWMLREMQDEDGGFYSAYDADSEGHEGKFYVWTRTEVRAALSPLEYSAFSRRFGLDEEPNFEGAWHAHVFVSIEQVGKELSLESAEVEKLVDAARAKLLAIRAKRVWPGLDDKVLTSWNALAIRGLAIAARAIEKPEFAEAAERALGFTRAHLWRPGSLEGAGCWPRRRMAWRISTPTSTTTRTSRTRCSKCCSSAGETRTPPGCGRSSTPCSNTSKTPRSAVSSSRRTTTKR